VGALAVTDAGLVVGVITIRDLANAERLLERLASECDDPSGHH
jgi:CBS domain-containing protein